MGDKNVRKHTKPGTQGFLKGNPGRKKGSVSKSVLTARKLMAEYSEPLMKKALSMALDEGNEQMLRFLVGKLVGKGLDVGVHIPVSKDPRKMTAALLKALQQDGVTADDAAGVTQAVQLHLQATEIAELQKQIKQLINRQQ